MSAHRTACLAAVAFAVSTFVLTPALAQLPATRLSGIYPAGAQAGQTVEAAITGADLDDVDRLMFSHAGITAKQKMAEPGPFDNGPQPVANAFTISVAANVPVGLYEVRATGKYGTSNPRAIAVGDLPEAIEAEPNNDREQATEVTLPVAINGQSNAGGDVDHFKFTAAAGQRMIVIGYARQIDSPMDTVVSVFDPAGRQLDSNRDGLRGDSLLDFHTPSAGEYVVKVHDSGYQGSAEHVYRLHVGVLPVIDYVFPPAAAAGGNRPLTLYGRNLPGGQAAGVAIDGRPLQKLAVNAPIPGGAAAASLNFDSRLEPASAGIDATEYRVKGPQGVSNPALIGIVTAPPVDETEPNNTPPQAQKLSAPCEVMGQFYGQRDRDWYSLQAKAGDAISIEVISARMGVRSHPSLLVQQVIELAEGEEPPEPKQLAYVFETADSDGGPEFDLRSRDPTHRFTAPADGTYRIMVRDAYGDVKANPRSVYRLAIYNGQPDFRLAAVAEGSHSAVLLRKGGQVGVRVVAFRRDGFDGEISVSAAGLPPGVTATEAIIGPAQNHTMLTLTAAANANPATGLIQIVGKAKIGSADVTRNARFGAALNVTNTRQNANQLPPTVDGRLTDDLAVSISASETSPIVGFSAGGGKVWEDARGGKLKIPVARSGDFKGKISFMPRGLPPNVTAPAGAIDANKNSGEIAVDLRNDTPTGTYTFYLDGFAEQLDYARNPEAAVAAAERQKEVDAIKAKADADAKAATDAKAVADKADTDAKASVTQATKAKADADQALTASTAAAKTAADALAAAKSAATANPDDANLAAAATAAQKASNDAAAKVKTDTAAVVAAEKALADATALAEAALKAKTEADEAAAEATRLAQLAAQLKTETDKLATDTVNAAKPTKRNVPIISTPVTLKITPAPITLAEPKAATPLKQGENLEVPVTIARLYEFKDPVNLQAILPGGVGGVSIPNKSIAANQTTGMLEITAAANATEGEHMLTLRATLNYNGQGITVEQPLRLVIEKVEAK